MSADQPQKHSISKQFVKDYTIASMVPVFLLFVFIFGAMILSGSYLSRLITEVAHGFNLEAKQHLQHLGEQVIQTKARDVARQMEIYFREHPDMTITEMREDPFFMSLAVQKVGETGYTAMTEAQTFIFRAHPNAALYDTDMRLLSEKLPGWWRIVLEGRQGAESAGYYDWSEPDGTTRKKYLVATPVPVSLNGATMMVSATAYIDDFLLPVKDMQDKAEAVIKDYRSHIVGQWTLLGFFLSTVILLSVIMNYFLGRRAAGRYIVPITQLAGAANQIGRGRWDVVVQKEILQRKDELGALGQDLNTMKVQLGDLFSRLEQRVTELVKTKEELERSEAHYRSLFEGVPVGLYRTSPDGVVLDVNQNMINMLGYPDRETFMSRNAQTMYMDPEDRTRWQSSLDNETGSGSFEIRMKKYNGDEIWVESHSRAVRDDAGTILYYEGSLVDTTERRRSEEERETLQEQLLQSQKLEAVGVLAGGVAHDFNNMLGAIIGYSELAMDAMKTDDPNYSYFKNILSAACHSADLTGQLLAFARRQTIAPIVLDINEAVASMLKILQRLVGENINLVWLPAVGPVTVKVDPAQFNQVLANLCVNARDSITGMGRITIETAFVSFDEACCETRAEFTPGEYVMLSISDDGCGMDREVMNHVFEPFFTTKRVGRGTGLGLATVYGIVRQNNGFINVYSETGAGSAFKVYFPSHQAEGDIFRPERVEHIPVSRGETVLIVEDDERLLDMSETMLKHLGYTVMGVGKPKEAVRLVETHDGVIDLLITDVVMPGMNGRELADRIVAVRPDMKCVFMSGYPTNVVIHQGVLEEGVNFIPKPFSMQALAVKIRTVLDQRRDRN